MSNNNDPRAWAMSLPSPYPTHGKQAMLTGDRFDFDANQVYRMPADNWEAIKDDPAKVAELVQKYITDHYRLQVPRIITLERYYNGDNDIHYWASHKAPNRADNRIASGLPRYITNIRVGYQFGNPIKFGYDNSDVDDAQEAVITDLLKDFNADNSEQYHEMVMGTNLVTTGRAYELMYVRKDSNSVAVRPVDPANAFIVYDTTIGMHSLFAVRYYLVRFDHKPVFYVDVYTDSKIYHYRSDMNPNGNLSVDGPTEDHYFGKVPMTEYSLADNRMGAWESKLDTIDAYDKSLSEMANSEEDFNNSILVISGDIEDEYKETVTDAEGKQLYDDNGNPLVRVRKIDPTKNMMFLKPRIIDNPGSSPTIVPTDAKYLTKELNASDWQTYVDQLMKDMHKDTNTPDMSDENFSGQATGAAMSYKLWGSDQEIATQEALYTKGLMRRLSLLGNYWNHIKLLPGADVMDSFKPTFTLNLPKNDAEIITNLKSLKDTGAISDETIQDKAADVTGVPKEQEQSRMADQRKADQKTVQSIGLDALTDSQKKAGGLDDESDDKPGAGAGTDRPATPAGRRQQSSNG
ncbi:phage portal protein [Levilactobacillus angrenensis]|uniref:phage portal protein n=1 Tax=Levilactobacillus angrenensis TaxID=2486020 RepID=UPI000F7B48B9|nr:phage portal protein [Levilactobacillus angrenensis]